MHLHHNSAPGAWSASRSVDYEYGEADEEWDRTRLEAIEAQGGATLVAKASVAACLLGSSDALFWNMLPWPFFIGHVLRGLDKVVPGSDSTAAPVRACSPKSGDADARERSGCPLSIYSIHRR